MAIAKYLVRSLSVKLAATGLALLLPMVLAGSASAANGLSGLQLVKTASTNRATVGKNITFTITDTNTNPALILSNVVIADNLPNRVNLVSATATGPNGNVVCGVQGNNVSCGPFTLAHGQVAIAQIVAKPQVAKRIRNTATDEFGNSASTSVIVKDKKRHHRR